MDKTSVTVDQYVRFREDGFLIVRGLLEADEVQELLDHVDELVAENPELLRVHMLHRELEIHERYLLHPRIVVVAGLIGPDVLALQTMLFVKGPGSPGQGYHQDSYHIITEPDTLIGAWVALDRADEENGCVWITSGSQNEPVYPDADESRGHGGDFQLARHACGERRGRPGRVAQRADADRREVPGQGATGRPRSRRRRLLRRPRPSPLPREPHQDENAEGLRRPLLQRTLPGAVGDGARAAPAGPG
jgi:Phytanoyl-CoA dioxygenase (PhyH)